MMLPPYSNQSTAAVSDMLQAHCRFPNVLATLTAEYASDYFPPLSALLEKSSEECQIPESLATPIKNAVMSALHPEVKEYLLDLAKLHAGFYGALKVLFDEIATAGGRVNLDDVTLNGFNFTGWNLSGMSVQRAALNKVTFMWLNLTGSDWFDVNLNEVAFRCVDMDNATWVKVSCKNVTLIKVSSSRMKTDDAGLKKIVIDMPDFSNYNGVDTYVMTPGFDHIGYSTNQTNFREIYNFADKRLP